MVRGGGKAVMAGYSGEVIKIPILVPPVLLCWWWMMMMMMMMIMVQWGLTIVLCLTAGGWWRTYSGLTPCGWVSDEDLQWFDASFTSWWGGGRDHHQPPRYTFPDSSLNSCLVQTSNVLQASLAMPPLKNLCLRHNQMAAARSWVGPYHGLCARDAAWGEQDSLQPG